MLRVFDDTANVRLARDYLNSGRAAGVTSNPSIALKEGVTSYSGLIRDFAALTDAGDVSLAVPRADPRTIVEQALAITSVAPRAFVKVPPLAARGRYLDEQICELFERDVLVNLTAITSAAQLTPGVQKAAHETERFFVSVFAGRLGDVGVDARTVVEDLKSTRLEGMNIIWAGARSVLDVRRAEDAGCHAITLAPELIKKISDPYDADLLTEIVVNQFNAAAENGGFTVAN